MGTIHQRTNRNGKTKSYRALIRLKGAKPLSATFSRLTDAREWIRNTESDIKRGRYFDSEQSKKHTVSDLIDRYLVDKVVNFRSSRGPQRLLRWWNEQIGHLTLDRISTPLIREHWDQLAANPSHATGKKRTNRTLNSYLENLGAMFSIAVREYGWMQSNPVSPIKKKPLNNQRTRFLNDEELVAFLKAVEMDSNSYLKPVVMIALSTGGRQSEILGLRWQDVDMKDGRVTFRDTKNGDTRSVALGKAALQALREHRLKSDSDSLYIFPSRRPRWKKGSAATQNPWEDISYPFRRARDAAGIEDFRFHDLRHCAASYLLATGATLAEVGKILGHRTAQMTWRYSHLEQKRSDELVERMTAKYLG